MCNKTMVAYTLNISRSRPLFLWLGTHPYMQIFHKHMVDRHSEYVIISIIWNVIFYSYSPGQEYAPDPTSNDWMYRLNANSMKYMHIPQSLLTMICYLYSWSSPLCQLCRTYTLQWYPETGKIICQNFYDKLCCFRKCAMRWISYIPSYHI